MAAQRWRVAVPKPSTRAGGLTCSASAVRSSRRMNASTGRAMFFSVSGPIGSNSRSSWLCTWSRTVRETQMPPTGLSGSSLAAMLTPSPCRFVPSGITSPMLIPMRKRIRRSGGWSPSCAGIRCCTWTAQRTAPSMLSNATSSESPPVCTTRPPCSWINGSISSRRSVRRRFAVPASSRPISRL